MSILNTKILAAVVALPLTAGVAWAHSSSNYPSNPRSVPEIDASAGYLAMAAVAAALIFVWERHKRAAKPE